MTTGAVVPYSGYNSEESFLIVGGHDASGPLDTIYYYEVATELWLPLDVTLTNPSSQVQATEVDPVYWSSIFC